MLCYVAFCTVDSERDSTFCARDHNGGHVRLLTLLSLSGERGIAGYWRICLQYMQAPLWTFDGLAAQASISIHITVSNCMCETLGVPPVTACSGTLVKPPGEGYLMVGSHSSNRSTSTIVVRYCLCDNLQSAPGDQGIVTGRELALGTMEHRMIHGGLER